MPANTEQGNPTTLAFLDEFDPKSPHGEESTEARLAGIRKAVKVFTNPLSDTVFRRLLADRDIRAEVPDNKLVLQPDGSGATNIIRRYIVTSKEDYPREVIQRDLLAALNEIFGKDGQFSEIQVKHHDEARADIPEGLWEVFLGEDRKGLIPLSKSGSGLKTVILVLLNLLVIPQIEKKPKPKFTFAFEELENNLHPALLRRLFLYLENYAVTNGAKVFLTTHSSTALDLFGLSEHAQIIHVTHDGESAKVTPLSAHFDRLGVVSELGAKPSDLLQANGIIWVEGPSDRVYLNRWIELFGDGELREGRDYQCAFYGGALLARTQFVPPVEAEAELVNLFRLNSNLVVVCDSDRTAGSGEGFQLKDRVARVKTEVENIPGALVWITEAKEIENYLPGSVLGKVFALPDLPDPGQYEQFFATQRLGEPNGSFVESRMMRKSMDKMDMAARCAPHLTKAILSTRFDLAQRMELIIHRLREWNA